MKRLVFACLIFVLVLAGCREDALPELAFAENWSQQPSPYAGPAYFPTQASSWRFAEGQAQLTHTRPNQQLHLLPWYWGRTDTAAEASVLVQFLHPDSLQPAGSYLGFWLGQRDAWGDFVGLRGGLTAEGKLFLADTTTARALVPLDLQYPWELRLRLQPQGDSVRLILSAHDPGTGRMEETVQRSLLRGRLARAQVALQAHGLPQKPGQDTLPQGWFDHWQLRGAGWQADTLASWGPILWVNHQYDQDQLHLKAYLLPHRGAGSRYLRLEVDRGQGYQLARETRLTPQSLTATMKVEATPGAVYRLSYRYTTPEGFAVQTWQERFPPRLGSDESITLRVREGGGRPVDEPGQEAPDLWVWPLDRGTLAPQGAAAWDAWLAHTWRYRARWQRQPTLFLAEAAPGQPWQRDWLGGAMPSRRGGLTQVNQGGLSLGLLSAGDSLRAAWAAWLLDWSAGTEWKALVCGDTAWCVARQPEFWSQGRALVLPGVATEVDFEPQRRRALLHRYGAAPYFVEQHDLEVRPAFGWLGRLRAPGPERPVIEVIEVATQQRLYALRLPGLHFEPPVFRAGRYLIEVRYPERGFSQRLGPFVAVPHRDSLERILLPPAP